MLLTSNQYLSSPQRRSVMLSVIISRVKSVFLLPLLALMLVPVWVFSQAQQRLIEKVSWRTEPIKIVRVTNKRSQIELGKKFSQEDDWLNGLTVTVKNDSNKA